MNFNKTCPLVLKDVYHYDITACHYQILDGLNYDVSALDRDNKIKRNIQIGLWLKENPRLLSLIRNITTSTINSYIKLNQLNDDDVILIAYDGVLTTKRFSTMTNELTPIELQDKYETLIISSVRKSYIARNRSNYTIKGVSHRYDEMDNLIKELLNINFVSKQTIFNQLDKIKKYLYESDDPELFCIPVKNKFIVFLKGYGETEIGQGLINVLDTDDIDKEKYFNLYLRPFIESIVIEYV